MSATPAERAAADELTRELDTVYASVEPTAEQYAAANEVITWWTYGNGRDNVAALKGRIARNIAEAVAAERAAIHARYEAALQKDSWWSAADRAWVVETDHIRQVAAR